jgi:hypothetical protein
MNPVIKISDWSPNQVKTLVPKLSDRGLKSIGLVSEQTKRALQLSTPMMTTWGIADYVDPATGESDGKYSASLQFPNGDYSTKDSDEFLAKLKAFESRVIDLAVEKSEAWFDEELSREVLKHNFFPFLKYSKNKDTKKIDYNKAPTLKVKVPFYDGKWGIEIFDDTRDHNRIFPSEDANLTPLDFVPKQSKVACVIQCGGIYIIGGKGWGITWKMTQCVVKPRENVSVFGKCFVSLSDEDSAALQSAAPVSEYDEDDEEAAGGGAAGDDDEAPRPPASSDAPDTDDEEAAPVAAAVVKKVVKKAAPVPPAAADTAVKKVVKKKVVPSL